jgi:hypothetical protein
MYITELHRMDKKMDFFLMLWVTHRWGQTQSTFVSFRIATVTKETSNRKPALISILYFALPYII